MKQQELERVQNALKKHLMEKFNISGNQKFLLGGIEEEDRDLMDNNAGNPYFDPMENALFTGTGKNSLISTLNGEVEGTPAAKKTIRRGTF